MRGLKWRRFNNVKNNVLSHSTRVRGLKSPNDCCKFAPSDVALYTSAWIEIALVPPYPSLRLCRTLHECVDWNTSETTDPTLVETSHSTRVRGLKSTRRHHNGWTATRRTLHECVDWNKRIFEYLYPSCSRTLHECVDWNSHCPRSFINIKRSHSTRVRGLKWYYKQTDISLILSHSTRVRGLKLRWWVQGLRSGWSHSTRVRGLKYFDSTDYTWKRLVALYTSAWIEIAWVNITFPATFCRTLHECVDWNISLVSSLPSELGRTLHECVDWNETGWNGYKFWMCRTLHECVDWNNPGTIESEPYLSRTLHECVDWNSLPD